jgi:hypothetical protein
MHATKPESKSQVPTPTDADILATVAQRPFLPLQDLARALWPLYPWDVLLQHEMLLAVAADRTARPVAPAYWLRCRCQQLIAAGELRLGPYDRRRVGIAGLTYRLPGSLPPILHGIPRVEEEVAHV